LVGVLLHCLPFLRKVLGFLDLILYTQLLCILSELLALVRRGGFQLNFLAGGSHIRPQALDRLLISLSRLLPSLDLHESLLVGREEIGATPVGQLGPFLLQGRDVIAQTVINLVRDFELVAALVGVVLGGRGHPAVLPEVGAALHPLLQLARLLSIAPINHPPLPMQRLHDISIIDLCTGLVQGAALVLLLLRLNPFLSAPAPRRSLFFEIGLLVHAGDFLEGDDFFLGEGNVMEGVMHSMVQQPTFQTVEGAVVGADAVILDGPHLLDVGLVLAGVEIRGQFLLGLHLVRLPV